MPEGKTQSVEQKTRGWTSLELPMSCVAMGAALAATPECSRLTMPIPLLIGAKKEDSACI